MAPKKQNSDAEKIEPGMVVEAAEGDLGEKDVSKPKVADVVEDQKGFYLILTAALAASLVLTLLHFNPIQLIFWANVLWGMLAPILVTYIFVIGNNCRIMRNQPLGLITNICLVVTMLISVAAAALLFYGLATGQGG